MLAVQTSLDTRDQAIFDKRLDDFNLQIGPRVGDFVHFADGSERRIAHLWDDDFQPENEPGSYYLGAAYCGHSGGLSPAIPVDELTFTTLQQLGVIWFFHHDVRTAHNSVHVEALFRVYRCSLPVS